MSLSILGKTTYRWSMRALGRGPRLRRVSEQDVVAWSTYKQRLLVLDADTKIEFSITLNPRSGWDDQQWPKLHQTNCEDLQLPWNTIPINKMFEFLYYSLTNMSPVYSSIGLGWGARAASSSPLGFVGLGKIGSGMVTNLTKERRGWSTKMIEDVWSRPLALTIKSLIKTWGSRCLHYPCDVWQLKDECRMPHESWWPMITHTDVATGRWISVGLRPWRGRSERSRSLGSQRGQKHGRGVAKGRGSRRRMQWRQASWKNGHRMI